VPDDRVECASAVNQVQRSRKVGQNAKSGRERGQSAITVSPPRFARAWKVRDPGRHPSEYGHSRVSRVQRCGSRSHGLDYADSRGLRRRDIRRFRRLRRF